MKTKTYQAISYLHLTTSTTVESKAGKYEKTVIFEGGSTVPVIKNGTFTTSDPDVQKSLEESSAFNVSYKLISTIGEDEDTDKGKDKNPDNNPPKDSGGNSEADLDKGKNPPNGTEPLKVSGIAGFQSAKAHILENFKDVTLEQVKTKELLLATAKTLNIEFTDLK